MNIKQTQIAIIGLYTELEKAFASKSNNELETRRHEADKIRHNRNKDWSERTAAEMVYVAASEKLGL